MNVTIPRLVLPSISYRDAYLQFTQEYADKQVSSSHTLPRRMELARTNFHEFLSRLEHMHLGIDLPDGFVPESTYWLMAGEVLVGESRLRHYLGTDALRVLYGHISFDIRPSERKKGFGILLLHLTLGHARKYNLDEVLISTEVENQTARAVIERNGGVVSEVLPEIVGVDGVALVRYVIRLK
jgi:predicted acetyltransferase